MDLVKFRQRIGVEGVMQIFAISVKLHGEAAEDDTVFVDTTLQEKAITYPTDTKLAIKIINRVNKLAKALGVKQRRTFVKEIKQLRIDSRFFGHVKKRKKARKTLKRLRTIADILMRELERKLPEETVSRLAEDFAMYRKILATQR
jgi:IS5 family transposase